MIIEVALLTIDPDRAAEFETAVTQAVPLFRASPGCHGMALERVIENPSQFRLVVHWETLEHHTQLFRNSAHFQSWRSLVGHFFTSPPEVNHSRPITQFFKDF